MKEPEFTSDDYITSGKRYNLTLFKHVKDTVPVLATPTLSEWTEELSTFRETKSDDPQEKKSVGMWCPANYCKPRRSKANVTELSFVVWDFDGDDDVSLEEVEAMVEGWYAIIHTTFSHGDNGKTSYRVIMPLARTVLGNNWQDNDLIWFRFSQIFRGKGCNCTKNQACLFYFPTSKPSNKHLRYARCYEGRVIDPYELPEVTRATPSAPREGGTTPQKPTNGKRAVPFQEGTYVPSPEEAKQHLDTFWQRRQKDAIVDGSAVDFGFIRSSVRKGYSKVSIHETLDADLRPGHYRKLIDKGKRWEARKWFEARYKDALEQEDTPEFVENERKHVLFTQTIRYLVQKEVHKGRMISTLAVLQAHITLCEKSFKKEWGASIRNLCVEANIKGTDPVSKHNIALLRGEWIKRVRKSARGNVYTFGNQVWRLLNLHFPLIPDTDKFEEILKTEQTSSLWYALNELDCSVLGKTLQSHEVAGQTKTCNVFSHKGLGKSAENVWLCLLEWPKTRQSIIKDSKLPPSTVYRVIKSFNELSIATEINKVVSINKDADFELLAQERFGVEKFNDSIRDRNKRDRQHQKEWKQRNVQSKILQQKASRDLYNHIPSLEPSSCTEGYVDTVSEETVPRMDLTHEVDQLL